MSRLSAGGIKYVTGHEDGAQGGRSLGTGRQREGYGEAGGRVGGCRVRRDREPEARYVEAEGRVRRGKVY